MFRSIVSKDISARIQTQLREVGDIFKDFHRLSKGLKGFCWLFQTSVLGRVMMWSKRRGLWSKRRGPKCYSYFVSMQQTSDDELDDNDAHILKDPVRTIRRTCTMSIM